MTIRLVDEAREEGALRRLAERDSAALPRGPVLGAWVGDRLLAAVGLDDDRSAILADPFEPSAGAASILASRAKQMRGRNQEARRLHVPRLLRGAPS